MKLFGFTIARKQENFPALTDSVLVQDQGSTIRPELKGITIPDNKMPSKIDPVRPTALTYSVERRGARDFAEAEYDLFRIGRVEDTDSYVHQAFIKKIGLITKEGWEFVGANPRTIQYIRLRFAQIARATGIPTDELIKSIGAGLIKKSNTFLVKVRKTTASGGRIRQKPGSNKELQPVAGYFVAPAETMEVDADEYGRIRRWKQKMPDGTYKEFNPDDVVHFYFNKKEGLIFGTPTLMPVIDDVRALRQIEENIELLVYQHLFPLFHYKIGTDQHPATINEYGESEIELAKYEIRSMPAEGGIVTSHRHQIEMVGAENRSLRAETYLDHFKKRLFAGLGISAVDMGEGECYDDSTQTLTENGWKFHWQIDHENEKIATFNPTTRKIEFHLANSKYESTYVGKMLMFENNNVNLCVTPHHDLWFYANKEWQKAPAIDVAAGKFGKKLRFIAGTAYAGDSDPGVSESAVRLAAHIASDSRREKDSILIRKKSRTYSRNTEELLIELGIKFSVVTRDRKTYMKISMDALDGYLAKFNTLSTMREVTQYPYPLRVTFVEEYIRHTLNHNNRDSWRIESDNKAYLDLLQELALSVGNNHTLVAQENKANYRFSIALNNTLQTFASIDIRKHVKVIDYKGVIYCYNVPNHLFVTRRKNVINIQGNTANRATSDTMSKNLVDSVKDIQRTMECQITDFLISELLQESTFGPDVLNEENMVYLKFKEIDVDHQIKKDSHYADLFNKDVISIHEARYGMGRQPFSIPTAEEIETSDNLEEDYPEWYATRWKLFEEPKSLIQAIDEPYSQAAKAAAASRATDTTESQRTEAGQEQMDREIQMEKERAKAKPAPTAKSKDSMIKPKYQELRDETIIRLSEDPSDSDMTKQVFFMIADQMIKSLKSHAISAFLRGYGSINPTGTQRMMASIRNRGKIESRVNFYVEKLRKDVMNALNRQNLDVLTKSDRIQRVRSVFDSFEYRTDFIEDVEIRKAYNLGVLEAARDKGYTTWRISVPDDACQKCKVVSTETYSLEETLDLDDIPPLHANSRAEIEILK